MRLGQHGALHTGVLSKTEVWTRHWTRGRSTARGKGLPPALREKLRTSVRDTNAPAEHQGRDPQEHMFKTSQILMRIWAKTSWALCLGFKKMARWKWRLGGGRVCDAQLSLGSQHCGMAQPCPHQPQSWRPRSAPSSSKGFPPCFLLC